MIWNDLSLHHVFSCSLLVIIRSCEWSDGPPEEGVTQSQAFTPVSTIYVGKPWTWWSKDREGLRVASTVNGHRHRISPLPFKQLTCALVDGLKVVAAISSIWERLLGCETAVSHWQQITSSRICFKNSELDIQSILGGNTLVRVRGCAIPQLATLLIYLSNVFFLKDIIIQGLIHISFVNKYINKYSRRNQSVLIKRSTGDTYSDTGNPVVQGPIGTGCINDIAGLTRSGNLSDGGLSSWRYCLT